MIEDPDLLGLGQFPLGQIAAGAWGFSDLALPVETTGERFLDPSVEDYANSSGEILRTTSVRQRVINLVVHRFGSSMSSRGVRFPEVHGPNTGRYMDAEVRAALRPLLDEGAIEIRRIVTRLETPRPGSMGIDVEFFNTQTGETELAQV